MKGWWQQQWRTDKPFGEKDALLEVGPTYPEGSRGNHWWQLINKQEEGTDFCTSLQLANLQTDENAFQVVFAFEPIGEVPVYPKAPSLRNATDSIIKTFVLQTLEDVREGTLSKVLQSTKVNLSRSTAEI